MSSRIKMIPIFFHTLDDTAVELRKLDEECYVWLQYGPTEGGIGIDKIKTYTKTEIKSMLEFLEDCSNGITALDLFEKFDNQ